MTLGVSSSIRLAALAGLIAFLSACATQQQSLAHDDVDRLFLKYAEIAQRPSPMSSDEAEEATNIMDRIRSSSDPCIARKFLKLFPVIPLLAAGTPLKAATSAELQEKKEEAKQYLKGLQDGAVPGDNCPYSGFPRVKIN